MGIPLLLLDEIKLTLHIYSIHYFLLCELLFYLFKKLSLNLMKHVKCRKILHDLINPLDYWFIPSYHVCRTYKVAAGVYDSNKWLDIQIYAFNCVSLVRKSLF